MIWLYLHRWNVQARTCVCTLFFLPEHWQICRNSHGLPYWVRYGFPKKSGSGKRHAHVVGELQEIRGSGKLNTCTRPRVVASLPKRIATGNLYKPEILRYFQPLKSTKWRSASLSWPFCFKKIFGICFKSDFPQQRRRTERLTGFGDWTFLLDHCLTYHQRMIDWNQRPGRFGNRTWKQDFPSRNKNCFFSQISACLLKGKKDSLCYQKKSQHNSGTVGHLYGKCLLKIC